MPRRKDPVRDYSRRRVHVDYLDRWAWSEDSLGRKSEKVAIHSPEDREAVESDLWAALDAGDPLPIGLKLTPRVVRAVVDASTRHGHLKLIS